MAFGETVTGQDLINEANGRLMGYQNAVDPDTLMSYINEGKDKVWSILRSLDENYFVTSSQGSDNTQNNYFPALSTTSRQYTLPNDFKDIVFIEVTNSGYEQIKFIQRPMFHPTFQDARNAATAQEGNFSYSVYFYDIVGVKTLVLAQYPEIAFNLTLWYVRQIFDFEIADNIPDIVTPFAKKISDYAVAKASLALQDQAQFEEWLKLWKDDVIEIASSAGPRTHDPQFVQDFEG